LGYGTGVLKAHLKKSILCILGDPRDKNMTKPSSKIRRDCCPLTHVVGSGCMRSLATNSYLSTSLLYSPRMVNDV